MINDMTVGMENLPNVFIDNIRIEPRSSNTSEIVVKICMYDRIAPHNSWKSRADLDLKLHVSFVSDLGLIDSLNRGIISLFDVDRSSILTAAIYTGVNSRASLVESVGDYSKYLITIKKNVMNSSNLNIYAACFVDGFGFNNPIFDKFYGPMAAEQVYVGGQLNTLSNYFYYPDSNEEYGGPVHQKPNGSYMEGSVHTEKPHKEVVMVKEENYKIQAFNVCLDVGVYADQPYYDLIAENTVGQVDGFDIDTGNILGGSTSLLGTETTLEGETVSDGPGAEY